MWAKEKGEMTIEAIVIELGESQLLWEFYLKVRILS